MFTSACLCWLQIWAEFYKCRMVTILKLTNVTLRKAVVPLENCEVGSGKNLAIVHCVQSHTAITPGVGKSLSRQYVLPSFELLGLQELPGLLITSPQETVRL